MRTDLHYIEQIMNLHCLDNHDVHDIVPSKMGLLWCLGGQ